MICFSNELGSVIYPKENTSVYIKMLAPLIPIMYLDTTVDHMLKGLGEQFYSMVVNIADSLISVILVWLLLPKMGINGYIVTIYATELINASFSVVRLMKKSGFKPHLVKWIVKPLLCIIGATCISHMGFAIISLSDTPSSLKLVIHILTTAIIYALLLVFTASFDKDDIKWAFSIFKGKDSIKSDACNHSA